MKIISNDDAYADALSTAAFATIPFIIFGVIGHPVVLYVSSALGILLFCGFLIRFAVNQHNHSTIRTSKWIADFMSLLQLPYVFAVSALILIADGIDATIIMWFCLAVAVLGAIWCIHDSKHTE
ncbi:MAG: hypothetical protein K2H72_07755 [Muribaculaceae bacterium]|nr:hypothetical protein [Muribaculaceae bacterium]